MSTDPTPPDPTSRPKLSSAVKGFVKFIIGSEEGQKSSEISEQTSVPTVPLRSPSLAVWVGNVLFWLSVIFSVGWLIVVWPIACIDGCDLGAVGIVFVVAIMIVGTGWGLRYILTR
jgi:hypothetical protein